MQPPRDRPFHPAHGQDGYRARLEWGQAGVRLLAARVDLVVVVDVLSFATAVSVALDRGATVIPSLVGEPLAAERARAVGAVLASPRRDAPGPTLSPASLLGLHPGERLVLPSPNGAACVALAGEAGAMVVVACLRNASAVGRFAASQGGITAVIAAGETWPDGGLRPAVEDQVGAGAVLAAMGAVGRSPEAGAAVAVFRAARDDLAGVLGSSASGRELADAGFGGDVAIAAELDATDLVPLLVDGALVGRQAAPAAPRRAEAPAS